jgi:hypothetical protein
VGLSATWSATVSSLEEQAVKPIVPVSAIALNKAKLKYFFIVLKKLVITIVNYFV